MVTYPLRPVPQSLRFSRPPGGGVPYKKLRAGWLLVADLQTFPDLCVRFISSYNPFSISWNEFLPLLMYVFVYSIFCSASQKVAGSIPEGKMVNHSRYRPGGAQRFPGS